MTAAIAQPLIDVLDCACVGECPVDRTCERLPSVDSVLDSLSSASTSGARVLDKPRMTGQPETSSHARLRRDRRHLPSPRGGDGPPWIPAPLVSTTCLNDDSVA